MAGNGEAHYEKDDGNEEQEFVRMWVEEGNTIWVRHPKGARDIYSFNRGTGELQQYFTFDKLTTIFEIR